MKVRNSVIVGGLLACAIWQAGCAATGGKQNEQAVLKRGPEQAFVFVHGVT